LKDGFLFVDAVELTAAAPQYHPLSGFNWFVAFGAVAGDIIHATEANYKLVY